MRGRPGAPPATIAVVIMGRAEFEDLVAEAIDEGVPEPFASALDEVAVVVEERGPAGWRRSTASTRGCPSRRAPCRPGCCRRGSPSTCTRSSTTPATRTRSWSRCRITVLHELGHHLGFDEDRLHDLGYG